MLGIKIIKVSTYRHLIAKADSLSKGIAYLQKENSRLRSDAVSLRGQLNAELKRERELLEKIEELERYKPKVQRKPKIKVILKN